MKRFSKIIMLCIAIILCLCFVACNSSDGESLGDIPSSEGAGAGKPIVNNELNRKVTYSVNISMRVDDVQKAQGTISEKSSVLGGYIQTTTENYDDGKITYVNIVYRVPTEKLDEFVSSVEGNGEITDKSVSTTDITTEYVNAQAQRNSLLERKQSLDALLSDTSVSASDKVNIINEISKVNAELLSIELLITQYDSEVDYSTVTVRIREKTTFGDVFGVIIACVLIISVIVSLAILISYLKKRKKGL